MRNTSNFFWIENYVLLVPEEYLPFLKECIFLLKHCFQFTYAGADLISNVKFEYHFNIEHRGKGPLYYEIHHDEIFFELMNNEKPKKHIKFLF